MKRLAGVLLVAWMAWMVALPRADGPEIEEARAKLAADYEALGKKRLAAFRLIAAREAFQRALDLAPRAPTAPALRARLRFIDAELALTGPRGG